MKLGTVVLCIPSLIFKVHVMLSDPRLILLKICAVYLAGHQVQISWIKPEV